MIAIWIKTVIMLVLGVIVAALVGALMGVVHAILRRIRPKHDSVVDGATIALMLLVIEFNVLIEYCQINDALATDWVLLYLVESAVVLIAAFCYWLILGFAASIMDDMVQQALGRKIDRLSLRIPD